MPQVGSVGHTRPRSITNAADYPRKSVECIHRRWGLFIA